MNLDHAGAARNNPKGGTPTQASLTVIICTKDRLEPLLEGLKALAAQTRPPDELIVVDSSNPPLSDYSKFSNEFTEVNFPGTTLQYLPSAPGLTRQKNLGIRHATGDLVAFLDDDARAESAYLEALCDVLDGDHRLAGGMGALQNVPRKPLLIAFQRIFMLTHSYGSGKFMLSGLPSLPHGREKFQLTEALSGGLMILRNEVLERHSFDEKLGGYSYMEDVDFSRRISREFSLFYSPDARVHHEWTAPRGQKSYDRAKMFVRHHGYLFLKNYFPSRSFNIVFMLWSVSGYFLMHLLRFDLFALRGASAGFLAVLRAWWKEG